jgi:serine/threonine protein kinase
MAQVWSATDTVLGRDVAVKLFREDLEDGSAARVKTEMQTLASLAHAGLVSVYDAGTQVDEHGVAQPFLVMELVEGPTLAACCVDGSLTSEQLVRVGAELAEALQYVHDRGVVHRDVKPANILLSPSGAKLADFGIARIVDGVRHTSTGLTVGTAPYLSPEQVTGDPVGPAADVYALGLVLLECLTGHREYTGGPVETALARLHRAPEVPASLPAPWPSLLRAMTTREPAQRPTAAQVATALRGHGEVEETKVLPSGLGSLGGPASAGVQTGPGAAGRRRVARVLPGAATTGVLVPPSVPDRLRAALSSHLVPLVAALAGLVLLAAVLSTLLPGSSPPKRPAVTHAPTTTPLQQHLTELDKAVRP